MTVLSFILSLIETVRFLLKDKVKTLSSNMYAQTIRLKHRKHTKMFYKRQHSVVVSSRTYCISSQVTNVGLIYNAMPRGQEHSERVLVTIQHTTNTPNPKNKYKFQDYVICTTSVISYKLTIISALNLLVKLLLMIIENQMFRLCLLF